MNDDKKIPSGDEPLGSDDDDDYEIVPAPLWAQIAVGTGLAMIAIGYLLLTHKTTPILTDHSIDALGKTIIYVTACEPNALTTQGWTAAMLLDRSVPRSKQRLSFYAWEVRHVGREQWCATKEFEGMRDRIHDLNNIRIPEAR